MRPTLRAAVLLSLAGSGLMLLALGRTWVEVDGVSGLTIGTVTDRVTGRDLALGATACAFVGLAGVVALIAARGWGRVLVGGLVVAAAVGAMVDVAPLVLSETLGRRAFEALARCDDTGCHAAGSAPVAFSAWPWLASGGAVLLFLGGCLTVLRGRSWSALGSSYEAPGARPEALVTDKGVWDALDRGDDPPA